MKTLKRLMTILMSLCMLIVLFQPIEASAESKTNKAAHKAYKKQMKEDKDSFLMSEMQYVYIDINGDGVDELLTQPEIGMAYNCLYAYKSGKAVLLASGYFECLYKKTNVLKTSGGSMGEYYTTYYKLSKGKSKQVAERYETYDSEDWEMKHPKYTYYLNGKKTTKAKYNKYIKKITAGKKVKLTDVKWKKY